MDERLRGLWRAAAGGDPEAQLQLLRERMRLGDRPRDLRLAAFLGDPGACAVLDQSPHSGLIHLVRGLRPFGKVAQIRAGLAAIALVADEWSTYPAAPGLVAGIEGWLEKPTRAKEGAIRAAQAALDPDTLGQRTTRQCAWFALRSVASATTCHGSVKVNKCVLYGCHLVLYALTDPVHAHWADLITPPADPSVSRVRKAITRVLIPWALESAAI